jgi:RNA polymerase sigma-70 factor (ECF subfamily)
MSLRQCDTTSPVLLERLGDWSDDAAWNEFVEQYRPLVEGWCRRMRLDAETTDELCQRIWINLADCISSFQYDPSRRFRGWLRRLCYSRAIDLIRERKARHARPLEDNLAGEWPEICDAEEEDENPNAARDSAIVRLGQEVHDSVRSRIAPQTWSAFWSIAIDGLSVRETADALKISYAAAFAARQRVAVRLRAEGRRVLAERVTPHPTGGPSGGPNAAGLCDPRGNAI